MGKKKTKAKRGKRGKSPRLLLRAAIEDMEHGQCGNAVMNLVAAAKKAPSRGKMKHHLDAVTSTFVRQCIRGGGGFNVPPSMRTARPANARPDPYAKLYKHAGPKGRLPGGHVPRTVPQSSDAQWYSAHSSGGPVPAPGHSVHTHPFEGLGTRRPNPNYAFVRSAPDTWGTRGSRREPIGHSAPVLPHACPNCGRKLSPGYSCPSCSDKGKFYMAAPRRGR